MKKEIIIVLLICIQLKIYSQTVINGFVYSPDTVGIPFANISIKNKPIGTCSNEKGYFKFNIDSAYINDTIVISNIGYRNYTFTINSLNGCDSIFFLEPANYELKAAIIINNAPTANEIIKQIFRNYGRNYPRTGYQAKAFFQDIVYNYSINADQEVARITEAAITMQEYGVQSAKEVKFRVDELRNSKNYIETDKKMEWIIRLGFGGLQNPVLEMYNEHDLSKKDFFKTFLEKNDVSLESIEFLDTQAVYVVRFIPKLQRSGFIYDYKIYVNKDNYAILKEDFNVTITPKFQEILGTDNSANRRKIKWYKNIDNKYYPYLIEYLAVVKDQGYKPSKDYHYVRHSFLMMNEIIPKSRDFKRIKWREKEDENDLLYNREFTYNEEFWDDFNVLYTQEEVIKAKQVLSKVQSIEKQFLEKSK